MNGNMTISFGTTETAEGLRWHCKLARDDGYSAGAFGDTQADALLRASVLYYNREAGEFNGREIEKQDAEKKDYSKKEEERYQAKRREPVVIMTTGALLEVTMAYDSMKIAAKDAMRRATEIQPMLDFMREKIDGAPFAIRKGGGK